MNILFKLTALLLVFSVEIRVHAESRVFSDECKYEIFGESKTCFLMNSSKAPVAEKFPDVSVYFMKDSVASVDSGGSSTVHWVKGSGLVESAKGVRVETRFGEALCQGECVVSVERDEELVSFHAIKGEWLVSGLGGKKIALELKAGLSISVGPVSESGESLWVPVFSPSKKKMASIKRMFALTATEKDLKTYEAAWRHGVETLSAQYQDLAQRKVASHEGDVQRRQRAKLRREKEDRELRELFRKKTLLD